MACAVLWRDRQWMVFVTTLTLMARIKCRNKNTIKIAFNPINRKETLRERQLDMADAGQVFDGPPGRHRLDTARRCNPRHQHEESQ